jgi:hypothetical protein
MATAVIVGEARKAKFPKNQRVVKINQVLPFRVKFTNIMVPGYSSSTVPPIGIALIGINNYIL